MSISPLSANLLSDLSQQRRQNPLQQIQQDFNQLASALQSGDLTDAQSAYSNIQQLLGGNQTSSNSNTGSNSSNPIQNDFAALGQALSSGNLSQAQSAFSQLQSDGQTAQQSTASQAQSLAQALRAAVEGHHHHHGHHGGGEGSTSQSSTPITSTTGSSTTAGVNIYA